MEKSGNKIVIFADSSIGLTNKTRGKVELIPLFVYFDDSRVYNEIDGITRDEFFKTLEKEQAYTSGCNPAYVRERLQEEINNGNDVLVFTLSSGISGTYNTIGIIANELNEELLENNKTNSIKVIDTKRTSGAISMLIEKAFELIDENKTLNEVYEVLTKEIDNISIYFIVDDLKYLARGGRISKSTAAIGDVLNIKPILYFNSEGKIELLNKVRGLKQGIKTIDSLINQQNNKRVLIAKAHNDTLANMLIAKTNLEETVDIDLAILSHTGPNVTGVIIYKE